MTFLYEMNVAEPVGCFNLVEDDDLEEVKPVTNSLHVPPPVNLEMDSSVGRKASPMKVKLQIKSQWRVN